MPKTYCGTFLLGRSGDTEDIEGCVVELPSARIPMEEQLQAALPQLIGTIQQTPPAYSALKVAGQRSYELARRGKPADLQPRPVEIHSLELIRYEYPELELRIRCGSGTYIRSLGRDLARAVGTEAVMSALRREAIGPFRADGLTPDALTLDVIHQRLSVPAAGAGGALVPFDRGAAAFGARRSRPFPPTCSRRDCRRKLLCTSTSFSSCFR